MHATAIQNHLLGFRKWIFAVLMQASAIVNLKYHATAVEADDLISIGTIGLMKAVVTFDPEKNNRLCTYAARCIENEILMYIRKTANQKTEISLDEPINMDYDGNELLLSDVLGTEEDMILRPLEDEVDLYILRQAVKELPPREREIIYMRFGLGGRNTGYLRQAVRLPLHDVQGAVAELLDDQLGRSRKDWTGSTVPGTDTLSKHAHIGSLPHLPEHFHNCCGSRRALMPDNRLKSKLQQRIYLPPGNMLTAYKIHLALKTGTYHKHIIICGMVGKDNIRSSACH